MPIKILVADARAASRSDTIAVLGRDRNFDVVGDASDGREALDLARSQRPDVVLLDGAILGMDAISVVEGLQGVAPASSVVVLIDSADMDLMRRLMRAGARDCLVRPVPPDDLLATVRDVYQSMQRHRDAVGHGAAVEATRESQIIAVYSPQGGAGKSMLAANLSVALARELDATKTPFSVALVDLNLQFGDIDLMLNLNPSNTIAGLAQKATGGIDAELMEQFLTTHAPSGLKILVAPSTPQYAESITVYTVEQVVEALRENYQFVVIDTPSQLQDTTLAALDAAHTILLVTSLDLLALHKTRTALEMLRQLYHPEKIQVVLNRANSQVGISIQDVETALGLTLRAQIPSDGKIVVTSVNNGQPFVLSEPNTAIAGQITNLARELLGKPALNVEANGQKKTSLLGKIGKMFD